MDKKLEIGDKVFVVVGPITSFNTREEADSYVKEAGPSFKITECKVDNIKDVTEEFMEKYEGTEEFNHLWDETLKYKEKLRKLSLVERNRLLRLLGIVPEK